MKWHSVVGALIVLIISYFCFTSIFVHHPPSEEHPEGNWGTKLSLGLDLQSGSHIAVELQPTENPITGKVIYPNPKIQRQSIQVFQNRLNPDGSKEVTITPEGVDRLIVELPGVTDLQEAENMVKKAGRLEFRRQQFNPENNEVEWVTVLDGTAVSSASISPQGSGYQINFTLTSDGGQRFGEITSQMIGKPLGIFFDSQKISAPNVQSAITGGAGQITGNFSLDEANELAMFLNAGSLPVDAKILESYTVSPTLGKAAVESSMLAALGGIIIVIAYMIIYYRMLGIVASLALIVYALITLGSMNIPGLEFVLTLPGIAGFILSIGMAVDANVLIFERIKEELRRNRGLGHAIDIGFSKAFSSIIDGHVTTFIGAAILFWLGSASIKGFGLTLMLGTIWSVVTATLVTRIFLDICTDVLKLQAPSLYSEGS